MPVLHARLIDAAVRPFSDNAEMKLSASKLLGNLPLDDEGAESAIRRWDLIDSRRRKSVVSTALFTILALVSAAVLTVSIREVIGYQKIFGWFRGDFTGDFPNPEELIGKDLTSDQKLLLFSDN